MSQAQLFSSFLRLLPAIYSRPEILEQHPFLGRYLLIFQKIMTGLNMEEALPHRQPQNNLLWNRKGWGQMLDPAVIGELFYPRLSFLFPGSNGFMPPLTRNALHTLNEFFGITPDPESNQQEMIDWLVELLDFIGSWIDLYLDHDFLDQYDVHPTEDEDRVDQRLDHMREIIGKIMPLFRKRGTREGLQGMIDLMIHARWKKRPLLEVRVKSLAHTTPFQVGRNSKLLPVYSEGLPVVGGVRPWLFLVEITILGLLPRSGPKDQNYERVYWHEVDETVKKITYLIDREKPEYSSYRLSFRPTMEVGLARLGQSSMLGTIRSRRGVQ